MAYGDIENLIHDEDMKILGWLLQGYLDLRTKIAGANIDG